MDAFTERAYEGGNAILDRLPLAERSALFPGLTVVDDEETHVLRARDQPIDEVYFPIDSVYSIVVELSQGHTYEVDVVGRDGVIGAEVAIGARVAARTVLCQVGGSVARVPFPGFERALATSPTLLEAVRASLRRQWYESQQTVACNFVHPADQRAARWILMTHDQIGRDRFPMRAEFLSIMLGLTTSGVREPMGMLEGLGCIRYVDDQVEVRSHRQLRDCACECYGLQRGAAFVGSDGGSNGPAG